MKKKTFQVKIWPISWLNDSGDFREWKKKKFTGVHASDPPRSLRLRRSFWKTVSIYPRSAPDFLLSHLWFVVSRLFSLSFFLFSFTKITPHIIFSRTKPSLTSCMMSVTGQRREEGERGAPVYCCQYAGRMSYTRTLYMTHLATGPS